jgi:hypothetical protein
MMAADLNATKTWHERCGLCGPLSYLSPILSSHCHPSSPPSLPLTPLTPLATTLPTHPPLPPSQL